MTRVKFVRALVRLMSPPLWAHLLRIAHYYAATHVEPRRRMSAGPGLRLSPTASLRNGERIRLGAEVHVGERSCLWAGDVEACITLGDNALLGPEVFITASNYEVRYGEPIMYQRHLEADVHVGSDVWLGARVVVLPGVTIGDGCVVGAGSVVTHDLPAFSIAVGSPARVIERRPGAPAA